MDTRFTYTNADGVQWAVTDYGNLILTPRRQKRRRWQIIGLLAALILLLAGFFLLRGLPW